jgi:glucose/mannose transport system permease protein
MTIPATIVSTSFGAVNGYVLSKWRFRGSNAIFALMTLGVFMPGQISLLPWAYILGALRLSNSVYGLILIHCVQGLSFTTLFCRNYYVNVPDDLIKAARIDGAGFWRIFLKIVLPLSPPILIVTVIWQFTGIWNEYLFGVVFTGGRQQPITSALVALSTNTMNARSYDVASAAVLIGAIPPLLIYFFGGKYFVRGLTQGAIK